MNASSGEIRRVSDGRTQVWEFGWSPNETEFAAIVSESPQEWGWYGAGVATIDSRGSESSTVFRSPTRQVAMPLWALDGKSIYFLSSIWSDRNVIAGDVIRIARNGEDAPVDLTEGYEGSISWMEWLGRDELLLTGLEGPDTVYSVLYTGKDRPSRRRASRLERLWKGEVAISNSHWRRSSLAPRAGRLAVAQESRYSPLEAWVGRMRIAKKSPNAKLIDWNRISDVNSHADPVASESRSIRWPVKSDGGLDFGTIQGFLVTPTARRSRKSKLPLIVMVHGGPTLAYGHQFLLPGGVPAQFFAANGFGVLLPNPRGSTGRGLRFAESNLGDLGGGDFRDIMAGVDYCLATRQFDPERLYIMGGSYGGFMTAWAITQTDRFRAAVMQWGISNWVSFHGTSVLPAWDAAHYGANPYNLAGPHWSASPIAHVHAVKTPTLIVVGGSDLACPVSQSQEFYRALKEKGVDTELVIYPGEGHGLSQRTHLLDAMGRYLRWFENH